MSGSSRSLYVLARRPTGHPEAAGAMLFLSFFYLYARADRSTGGASFRRFSR